MKDTSLYFPISRTPDDADEDIHCIDFGKLGKITVQAVVKSPSYSTELLIEDDEDDEFDFVSLDIEHFTDCNHFKVRFEAMSKAKCLRYLKKLTAVVKALPAVGIAQPQQRKPWHPPMPEQANPPLALTGGSES